MKKHVQSLLLLAALLLPWATQAQSYTLENYGFTTGVDATKWVDMTGSTQILTPSGSDGLASSVQTIGFSFPFGGSNYTQYSVNTDGNLRLGSTATSTGTYTTPFSSANAGTNSPKINAFGCDGYGNSGSHYVKAMQHVTPDLDTMLVVEFCTGTFNSNTRSYLYKWQIHLHTNGNIDIVFPDASGIPSTAPAVAHQCGMCVSASDGWIISSATNTAEHFTNGSTVTNASDTWFDANRYYSFVHPNNISCAAPTSLAVNNITVDGATFTWTAGGTETEWEVTVDGNSQFVYTNTYTATGLDGNTPYVFSVRAICGAGDTSFASSVSFRTACAAISSMPFSNDFESEPNYSSTPYADAFPNCWHRINDASGTYNYYPYLYASSTYAHSGGVGMYWYHATTTTYADNMYAVLPPVDENIYSISDLTLSFYAKTTSASYHPQPIVGVMTDPTNASTFTPVYTFTATEITTAWQLYVIHLSSYTGAGNYIAIKWPRPTSTCYLAIDDIYLTDEWCDVPLNVTASATTDEVTVSWNTNGGSSFTVILGEDTVTNVYDSSYTFYGLTPNTAYNYSVATECDSSVSSYIGGSIRTLCLSLDSLPYTYGFEDLPTGSTTVRPVIPCWHHINNGTQYFGYPYPSSSYSRTGSRSLYWYASTTAGTYSDYQLAVLPAVDTDIYPINTLMLEFWARPSSTSYSPVFQVGVMTDPTDNSTFQLVETVNVQNVTTFQQFEVPFSDFTGYGQFIAVRVVRPTSAWYAYTDDFTIKELPACPHVASVTPTHITQDSIVISWTPVGTESTWVVTDGTNEYVAYDTTYAFDMLTENTPYTIGVAPLCDNGDTGDFVTISVRTACGYLTTLPYTENFDGMTGSTATTPTASFLPPCWDYFNHGTRTNYMYCPYVYNSSTYAHSGSNCIRFYSYNSSADSNQYLILPLTDPVQYPVNHLTTNFWLRGYSTSTTYHADVVVGVMTNIYDESSFVPVATVTNSTTSYTHHEVSFIGYTGPHGRVALKFPKPTASSNYEYGYVDDIVLEPLPACPAVANMRVDSLGVDWASISWHDAGDGTSWVVEYDTVDFTPGAGTASNIDYAYDTNYMMYGLDTGHTYYVYVRADCGADTSYYTAFSVTTLASEPATVPYSCTFEGSNNNGWDLFTTGQTNYWMVGNATGNPGRSLYVTNDGSTNNYTNSSISYSYAVRVFNLSEAGEYAYSFDWKCQGEGNYDFIRAFLVSASEEVEAGVLPFGTSAYNYGQTVAPAGWMDLTGRTTTPYGLNGQSSWQTRTGTVTITTPGTYNLIFSWSNDGSGGTTPPGAIDNVSLVRNTCPAPINLTASHVTADSIVVEWQAVGEESTWLVSNGIDTIEVYDTTYVFDNLNSSTGYPISVRAICDYSDTSMATSMLVYTACLYATLPIIENFDGITGSTATSPVPEGFLPPCWDIFNHGTRTNYQYSPYVYSSTTYSHSGSNCIRFYSYNSSGDSNQYLILPVFDSNDYQISGLQLSFWLRGNSTSSNYFANVVVGVMTDINHESSFIPYDTINYASTTYAYQEVNLNRYTGPHGRIALFFPKPLSSSQYEYGYVDDLMLGPIPSCLSVDNLTSIYNGQDSVILSWNSGGSEYEWEVSYDSVVLTAYDTVFAVDNLLPNTVYNFTVRAICGAGDTSFPVSYTTRTACGAIDVLPYIESFEGLPVGSSSDLECGVPCWGRLDNAGQYHFGYIGSPSSWPSGGHTGTGFLYYYMPTTTGTYADWIYTILPPIDTLTYPLDDLQVSFWVKMNSATTTGDIQIGVFANANDATTFVPVDTVHVAGNVYELKTAYLSNFTGYGNRIALKFTRNASTATYYFLDDVTVEVIPDCPPVSGISATRITSDSLYISWSENGDATSWAVEYGPAGFTPGTGTTDNVYSLPYPIGGLTANTAYDVYITPECFTGVAATRMGTFTTGCIPFTVPFTESFDTWSSTAADPLPNCWEKHTNYSTNYPYASTSYYHTGTKAMYMYSTNTTYSYMVLPEFELPIDSTMISFWLYKTNTSYAHKLKVGVMTNPADINTFVEVSEVVPTALSTWEEFEVSLANYTGTGTRIAIMSPNNEYSYPYLDDLTVTRVSNCPRVDNLAASTVMLDSAMITWVDHVNTSWYLEYDSVDFTPGTRTAIAVTDTFYLLTGLTAGNTYHVYVYPDCDSTAYRHLSFTTLAALPATVPYSCDFEAAGVNGWDFIQAGQGNYWMVGNATGNTGRSMYVTDNGTANNYSGNASYSFAVRTFSLAAGNYVCSYDWKCNGESSYDFIRVALVPAGANIEAGGYSGFDNTSAMPSGSIALDGAYRMNLQTTWATRTTEFTLASAGTYKLVFMWRNDGSVYNNPPAAIDNVAMALNTCPMPGNIALSNLTQTSTDVTWHESGSATEWQYEIAGGTPVTVYDTNCTLTGLSTNTLYTFRVRSICGIGDTGMWASYTFRTPCGFLALPYMEDFEAETTGSSSTGSAFVNCWTRLNNGTSYGGYPYVGSSSTYNHTTGGGKGLYWYNTTTTGTYGDYLVAVLPPLDPTVPVDSLQLSFWAKASSTSYYPVFQIGVMTDPNNIATFVGVDTVTVNSGTNWSLVEVPLTGYTGNGHYVAVKVDRASAWTAYTDDYILEYVPTCLTPRDVHQTAASTTSVTVDWTDLSTAATWEISYSGPGATGATTVYAHPATINGLTSMSAYQVRVRPICGAGDTARWSEPTMLVTAMCDNAQIVSTATPTSSTGTSYYAPVNNFYHYTLTETIIDSTEIGGPMDIQYLAYYYDYATAVTQKSNCTVYFQPTTKTAFSANTDVVPLSSDAVKVYMGDFNFSQGWNYLTLDTVYHYDGTGNLMVIVDDNSNLYPGSAYVYRTQTCSAYKTLAYYSDSYDPDPSTITSGYSGSKAYYQYRPDMQLISCGAPGCHAPTVTSVTGTYQSATMTWAGTGTDYEVAIKAVSEPTWPAETAVTTNTYTFTGLLPATPYQLRVRRDCTADSLGFSDWVITTFVTDSLPCLAPDTFGVIGTTNATATFAWLPAGNETAWEIFVWNNTWDSLYSVTTIPATVSGFTAGVSYNATIRAMCGTLANIEGPWGDTITFTAATCGAVTGLATSNVTSNSVTLTWTAVTGAMGYRVVCTDGQDYDTVTVTVPTHTFTGLYDATPYTFYVQTMCGAGWYSENWAQVTATTTPSTGTNYYVTTSVNNAAYGSVSGGGSHPANSTVTLTATPNTGYSFTRWNDNVTTNPRSFVVTSDTSFMAYFSANQYTVTVVNANPTMGAVTGTGTYAYNTTATITATPNSGYHFTGWNDGDTHTTRVITVTCDTTFTAGFAPNQYTVTAVPNDASMGSVTGSGTYDYGTTATLTATPNTGYGFRGWSDGNTANPRSLVVTGDITLTANFSTDTSAVTEYTVTLTVNDPAMGSLSDYGGTYAEGSTIVVTATPNAGYHFVNWSDNNTDNPRTFIVNSDITLQANFAQNVDSTAVLNIVVEGNGYVTVNGTESSIYRGRLGEVVTLVAEAYEGAAFRGWSDGNTDATRSFTLTENNATLTATFGSVGIDAVATASCTLYPNPAKGATTVSVTGISGKVRIAVLDLSGREVLAETLECSADCEKSLDIEGLAEGAYFVRITSEQTAPMVKKLIVR